MKKLVYIIVLLTINFSFSQSHPIDVENRKCLENTMPTTLSGAKCEHTATASWKKLMDSTLQKLKANPKQLSVALLEDSQKKWLEFQKSDLAFRSALYRIQNQGGTMTIAATATHEKRQFRERTLYLLELLELFQEE